MKLNYFYYKIRRFENIIDKFLLKNTINKYIDSEISTNINNKCQK